MFLFVMVSSKFTIWTHLKTMLYTVLAKQRGDKEKEREGWREEPKYYAGSTINHLL